MISMKSTSKHFAIATVSLIDEATLQPSKGGLQRWCWDVAKLLVERGYSVTIYQKASRSFETALGEQIKVIGIKTPQKFWGNLVFSRIFSRLNPVAVPVLYVSQELMIGFHFPRSVAVNHGIWWDSDFSFWKRVVNKVIQKSTIKNTRGIICVDTNYINWCHAEIPNRLGWRHKLKYVPNYADETQFGCNFPSTDTHNTSSINILFPRRLGDGDVLHADGRGALFLLQALAKLKKKGVVFQVEFAGPGTLRSQVIKFAQINGFEDCVKCNEYDLEHMHIAYAKADVVVIPSMSHEGTSLSAVEAMCAGKPTVVTHIGGLPNLVINGLNGFMCDLSVESLSESILEAAKRRNDHNWQKGTAQIASMYFGKERWDATIWKHLSDLLEL